MPLTRITKYDPGWISEDFEKSAHEAIQMAEAYAAKWRLMPDGRVVKRQNAEMLQKRTERIDWNK
jgi:hypothetical protein